MDKDEVRHSCMYTGLKVQTGVTATIGRNCCISTNAGETVSTGTSDDLGDQGRLAAACLEASNRSTRRRACVTGSSNEV